jgi:ABC-type spermidine/putrescine transport system permease subunit I
MQARLFQAGQYTRHSVLMWPAAILITLFCISLAALLEASFHATGDSGGYTLAYYVRVLTEPLDRNQLVATLRIGFITVLFGLLLALPISFWVVRTRRNWVRVLLIMSITVPFLTSMIVRLYALTIILANTGLVNQFVRWAGWIPHDSFLPLLRHEPGVIIGTTAFVLPFMIFMLIGSFRRMDTTLEEAASSLGANEFKTFFRITLPLLTPGIVSAASLGFVLASVAFSTPLILGGGTVNMIANAVYSEAVQSLDRGVAATLAVISLVVTVFVLYGARRFEFRSGG